MCVRAGTRTNARAGRQPLALLYHCLPRPTKSWPAAPAAAFSSNRAAPLPAPFPAPPLPFRSMKAAAMCLGATIKTAMPLCQSYSSACLPARPLARPPPLPAALQDAQALCRRRHRLPGCLAGLHHCPGTLAIPRAAALAGAAAAGAEWWQRRWRRRGQQWGRGVPGAGQGLSCGCHQKGCWQRRLTSLLLIKSCRGIAFHTRAMPASLAPVPSQVPSA